MAAEWYFSIDGQQRGPVSWDTVLHLAMTGRISPDDFVWSEMMPKRVLANSVIDFPSRPESILEEAASSRRDHSDSGGIDVVRILEINRQMTAADRCHFCFGILLFALNILWSLCLIAVVLVVVAVALICFVGGVLLIGIAWMDTPPPFHSRLLATLAGVGVVFLSVLLGLAAFFCKKRFLRASVFSLVDVTPYFDPVTPVASESRAEQEASESKRSNALITAVRCAGAVVMTIPISFLFHSSVVEAVLVGLFVGIFAVLWGINFRPFTESPLVRFRAETAGEALVEGIVAGIVVPIVYAIVLGIIAGLRAV